MSWCALDVAVQLLGQIVEGGVAVAGGDGRAFDFGGGHDYESFQTFEVEENLEGCGC